MPKHLIFLLLIFLTVSGFTQDKRLALVIGNAAYQHGGALKNPVNDANLMAQTLQDLNFEVIKETDASLTGMQSAFKGFVSRLSSYDVALFFYAGHGMQVDGENYLIPVDAKLENKLSMEFEAFKVSSVNHYFASNDNKLNIMILDACRNNPYRSWMRSGGRGFTAVTDQGAGTIIAFATREGEVASDGDGNNGLFTEQLVKQMKTPQNITEVFQNTRVEVLRASNKQQVPQEWNMLTGNFYFTKTMATASSKPVISPDSKETTDLPFMDMVFVKGGSFMMGNSGDSYSENDPVHEVFLNDFEIGRYEVTQEQWQEIMGYNPSKFLDCDQCPVETVSWFQIQDFLKNLNAKLGTNYRLPTEAEWEYAARGGIMRNGFSFSGSDYLDDVGWYSENSDGRAHPVGQKKPNKLGLFDMTGNVAELCSDWYVKEYYKVSDSRNPQGPSSAGPRNMKSVRGGSWYFFNFMCSNTYRGGALQKGAGSVGFRVARSVK